MSGRRETVTRVRPDPDVSVSFDGERCAIRPRHLAAGDLVIGYADALHPEGAGAILTGLSDTFTYPQLRTFLGPDGSLLPPETQPPDGLEIIAFLQGGLAEATVPPSVIAAVCASGGDEDSAPSDLALGARRGRTLAGSGPAGAQSLRRTRRYPRR